MSDMDDPRGPVPEAGPLDELASALLDGEATVEEQARAGDAEVAARVAAFAQVARAVGEEIPPVDDSRREAAIAAGLGASRTTEAEAEDRFVDQLSRRRRRPVQSLRLVGVAAAVVAAVALGTVAFSSGSDDADVASESAILDESADGAPSAEADGADRAGPPRSQLGEFDDIEILAQAARDNARSSLGEAQSGAAAEAAPTDDEASDDAVTVPFADPFAVTCAPFGDGELVSAAEATLRGQPVQVFVIDEPDGAHVHVFEVGTCEEVADLAP